MVQVSSFPSFSKKTQAYRWSATTIVAVAKSQLRLIRRGTL